jgi:hypothetical protein
MFCAQMVVVNKQKGSLSVVTRSRDTLNATA